MKRSLILKRLIRNHIILEITVLSKLYNSHFLQIQRLQPIHRIPHKIKILRINLPRNLQILQLPEILIRRLYRLFQFPSLGFNHDILLRRCIMRYHIILPRRDRLAHQHKLVCPGILLLIHLYREIMHLRRHVSKHLFLLESINHTIYRNLKQLRPGTYFLRHDNCPEFPVFLVRYRSRGSNRSRGCHFSRCQIYQCLSFSICHQHLFLQPRPFTFGKPLAFHKRHPCRTHFMTKRQTNHFCRGSYLLCFAPKKITRLVTS